MLEKFFDAIISFFSTDAQTRIHQKIAAAENDLQNAQKSFLEELMAQSPNAAGGLSAEIHIIIAGEILIFSSPPDSNILFVRLASERGAATKINTRYKLKNLKTQFFKDYQEFHRTDNGITDLTALDLYGLDVPKMNFYNTLISAKQLAQIIKKKGDLSGAILETGTTRAQLKDLDFSRAQIDRALAQSLIAAGANALSVIKGLIFCGVNNLSGFDLRNLNITKDLDLQEVDLSGAKYDEAILRATLSKNMMRFIKTSQFPNEGQTRNVIIKLSDDNIGLLPSVEQLGPAQDYHYLPGHFHALAAQMDHEHFKSKFAYFGNIHGANMRFHNDQIYLAYRKKDDEPDLDMPGYAPKILELIPPHLTALREPNHTQHLDQYCLLRRRDQYCLLMVMIKKFNPSFDPQYLFDTESEDQTTPKENRHVKILTAFIKSLGLDCHLESQLTLFLIDPITYKLRNTLQSYLPAPKLPGILDIDNIET